MYCKGEKGLKNILKQSILIEMGQQGSKKGTFSVKKREDGRMTENLEPWWKKIEERNRRDRCQTSRENTEKPDCWILQPKYKREGRGICGQFR